MAVGGCRFTPIRYLASVWRAPTRNCCLTQSPTGIRNSITTFRSVCDEWERRRRHVFGCNPCTRGCEPWVSNSKRLTCASEVPVARSDVSASSPSLIFAFLSQMFICLHRHQVSVIPACRVKGYQEANRKNTQQTGK